MPTLATMPTLPTEPSKPTLPRTPNRSVHFPRTDKETRDHRRPAA